jgi:hypothetical protein
VPHSDLAIIQQKEEAILCEEEVLVICHHLPVMVPRQPSSAIVVTGALYQVISDNKVLQEVLIRKYLCLASCCLPAVLPASLQQPAARTRGRLVASSYLVIFS